jgi:transcriptional regulator with XRE-family HTH domain
MSLCVALGGEMKDREGLIRMAIGDLVRAGRKDTAAPLTQAELAHRAGISCEHLSHIENYRTAPSVDVLDRLARSLGHATVSELLDRDMTGVLSRTSASAASVRVTRPRDDQLARDEFETERLG